MLTPINSIERLLYYPPINVRNQCLPFKDYDDRVRMQFLQLYNVVSSAPCAKE